MALWSTIPYAFWQLSYHFFITVRRREKIAAGRPTSFTWLRRSYSKTWIGKVVLSLPEQLQEPAFMMIQYCYAVLTMLPCPIWFYSRWASAAFLLVVFTWSIYNGATYYIDVFGKRFQKELEAMKTEVAKWHSTPESVGILSPGLTPHVEKSKEEAENEAPHGAGKEDHDGSRSIGGGSVDSIPLLSEEMGVATGADMGAKDVASRRKAVEILSAWPQNMIPTE